MPDDEVISYACLSNTQKIWLGMMVLGLLGLILMVPLGYAFRNNALILIILGVLLMSSYTLGSLAMAINSSYREIKRRFA